ncbi:MAG: shikimate dehydrogenase [Candidatus Marinimicrobia bacterium]|jgi:shikimate dehydrogenase|nr:shikimate dehydrogenase [Candidatus Neomarinimicrobiota bacterium]MDP6755193.1 shikimate dehydrogenase [Candidatus Neomarinimicrobiota bacterium]|tara:strand:- start:222 stop:1037 length:816 start_codon:yes stop_codon:yes gene_type:complete
MKRFAVIGDPIAHSLSPALHSEVFRQIGFEVTFEKIHVKPDTLHSFMGSHRLDGFNMTIPHKQSIIPFLDELDDAAQSIGAVNCVHKGKGFNTDWVGFLKTMEVNKVLLKGKDCVILGAGGAARAIAYAFIQSKVKSIIILNRTLEKAKKLTQWIQQTSTEIETYEHMNASQHDHIIINCTPVGMWPDVESMPDIEIQKGQILADTIYNPLETAWLKKGKEIGAKTVGGLDMFIAQGLASADIWFNEKISEKVDIDKIRKILINKLTDQLS